MTTLSPLLCQVFARGLIERGAPGAIVNISSQASQRCLPKHAVYCTSKAAVDHLTRCLAYELGPHKVRYLHVTHTSKTTYCDLATTTTAAAAAAAAAVFDDFQLEHSHQLIDLLKCVRPLALPQCYLHGTGKKDVDLYSA